MNHKTQRGVSAYRAMPALPLASLRESSNRAKQSEDQVCAGIHKRRSIHCQLCLAHANRDSLLDNGGGTEIALTDDVRKAIRASPVNQKVICNQASEVRARFPGKKRNDGSKNIVLQKLIAALRKKAKSRDLLGCNGWQAQQFGYTIAGPSVPRVHTNG